ncbi:peptide MFS transporter [uncultured Microscilla sp.]|uniref:peptide MFS transporter n=1 Tax=uncultured Microscilla sp. TaxID=432653 RepID=UPI00261C9219|nr:peptide MFS transporter [uncultured Microscilla sp.]
MSKSADKAFLGHPVGLAVLFFTEMWERFSYYGMRAILVLFIIAPVEKGGLGWSNVDALALYGWYTMMVYVMGIPGGIIADRWLGQKKTVLIGGLILCAGHGVLAIQNITAFYAGLVLIVIGVGGLKPNISTIVGGLYKAGDPRRDRGFTLFYIGINLGAFLSSLIVPLVASEYGWHYGFGLAGIGMLFGQILFVWGQKYLKGVGDYKPPVKVEGSNRNQPLTKVEKDRLVVLFLSFIIIIVFWGAFEQAGGLMNIYAQNKIDRMFFGWEIPAGVFQAANSFFIITLGVAVASFWATRQRKGKESSSLFKMAIGTIIMGFGFFAMAAASVQAGQEPFGKGAMIWLILAYLLHTVGELSSSPVSLSFITKLAPARYASIMMGVYFASTGFGNKLAGLVGEASQVKPINIELKASPSELKPYTRITESLAKDKNINFKGQVYMENNQVVMKNLEDNKKEITPLFELDKESTNRLRETLKEEEVTAKEPMHFKISLSKKDKVKESESPKGDGKNYEGTVIIDEVQNALELKTFLYITIFTTVFGLLLIIFLKKLKALTHGVEEEEANQARKNADEKEM